MAHLEGGHWNLQDQSLALPQPKNDARMLVFNKTTNRVVAHRP